MKGRKSYYLNFDDKSLMAILKQRQAELESLNKKEITADLETRKQELKFIIKVIKDTLVKRYKEENLSFQKIALGVIRKQGIEKDIYRELFILSLMENNSLVDKETLDKAIDELNLDQLLLISNMKQGTIYQKAANNKLDEFWFDVEDDVLDEFVLKKKMDERRD